MGGGRWVGWLWEGSLEDMYSSLFNGPRCQGAIQLIGFYKTYTT